MARYTFDATLWVWEAHDGSWHFVTFPTDIADEIEDLQSEPRRGFGAIKVRVTIGGTTWTTSAFPSRDHQSLILPIKAAVRAAEALASGDTVVVAVDLVSP